jgi:hypothetical protein
MRHVGLLAIFFLGGCYSMQSERVLVIDSTTMQPVAGVRISEEPTRGLSAMVDLCEQLRPLPPATAGVSDAKGRLVLSVPVEQCPFILEIGSEDYRWDVMAREPKTKPIDVDTIYQVHRRRPVAR